MNTYSETTIVTRDLCASGTDVPRALAAEPQTGKVGNDQPCTSTEIIARGRASLAHIERGHWPDWRNVIAALAAGRTIALLQAGTNVPQGRRYREAMGRWLRCHGFDRIDKADRARLLKVADNLTAIDEWRNGLPPEEQLRLNHPRTVLATWNATQRPSSPPPPPPPPAGANARDDVGPESLGERARLSARIDELQNERRRLEIKNIGLQDEIEAGATADEKMAELAKLNVAGLLRLLPATTRTAINNRIVEHLTVTDHLAALERKLPEAPKIRAAFKALEKALRPSPTVKSLAASREQGAQP